MPLDPIVQHRARVYQASVSARLFGRFAGSPEGTAYESKRREAHCEAVAIERDFPIFAPIFAEHWATYGG